MAMHDAGGTIFGPFVPAIGETGVQNPVWPIGDLRRYGLGLTSGVDATTALTNATLSVNALGGGVVYIPAGTWTISTRINLVGLAGVRWQGAGRGITILKASGSRTSLFSSFPEPTQQAAWIPTLQFVASKLSWRGITFDMDYNTVVDGGVLNPTYPTFNYPADNYQYPIMALYINGVDVADCEFLRCWYNGIEIYSCNDVLIKFNKFDHVADKLNYTGGYYSAVEIDAFSHRVHLTDNDATNVGYGWDVNASNQNASPDGVLGASDIFIERNSVNTAKGYGVQVDGYVNRLAIRDNAFANLQFGVMVLSFNEAATNNYQGIHGAVVSGNVAQLYNLSRTSGVTAMDLKAADLLVLNNVLVNALPNDVANSYYGIFIRQLIEKPAGVPTNFGNIGARGNLLRGCFVSGYAVVSFSIQTTLADNRVLDSFGDPLAAFAVTTTDSVELHNAAAWSTIRGPRAPLAGNGRALISAASADVGDVDLTLTLGVSEYEQRYESAVTANRTVSIGTLGAGIGDRFRVVRTGLGAGTINVQNVITMPAATKAWAEVVMSPAGTWKASGYGVLP